MKTADGFNESLSEFEETQARLRDLYVWTRRGGLTWQAACAAFGLAGGMLASTLGALLSSFASMSGGAGGVLSTRNVGGVLLLSTIPLLLLGAHCLDLLEGRAERSLRPGFVREGEAAVSNERASRVEAAAAARSI